MATNTRKHRRQKELLEAGRKAKDLVGVAQEEKAALERELAKARDDLHDLRNRLQIVTAQHDEITIHSQDLERELSAAIKELADQNESFDLHRQTIAEQRQLIHNQKLELAVLNTKIADLQAEDKDSSKLRRRLATAKEELAQAHTTIHQLKRADAF